MTSRGFWWRVVAIWAALCLLLVVINWGAITAWRFPDPDDQMRLLEVRDWLGGQSWFDVAQHRLNAPAGVPMHWSRLVDLPIAAVILGTSPLLGTHAAELLALVLVPMMTLGVVIALLAALARRLECDDEQALMAVCVAPFSVEVLHQLQPMRIDHHGWQMALALLATYALIDANARRAGYLVGTALALWLSISLEGLPMVGAILALVALKWAFEPAHRDRFRLTTSIAAGGAVAVFAVTHPWSAWRGSACDAISPAYLAPLVSAALGAYAVTAIPFRTLAARVAGLAIVGAVSLASAFLIAPQCAAGPFGQLDPLVRHFWYLNVMEGLPLWVQTPATIANTIALPLIGLIGTICAVRENSGPRRDRWASLLFLTAAATMAAIFVQRAGGLANLLAIPGAVWLIHPLLLRARTIGSAPRRVLATLGVLSIAAPGLAAALVVKAIVPQDEVQLLANEHQAAACLDGNQMQALRALPRGNVLAPLDISPTILVLTQHDAVASGHHRGVTAMHDVIAAFTGPDAVAHRIVISRRIDYIAYCPGLPEILIYENEAPSSFVAHLDQGKAPDWLAPVVLPGSPVKAWRVITSSQQRLPPTPRQP
ncbi:MAG: hypothetical protein ABIS14_05420 [Sphingomonas sp.]